MLKKSREELREEGTAGDDVHVRKMTSSAGS